MNKIIVFIITCLTFGNLSGQTTSTQFELVCGEETDSVKKGDLVELFYFDGVSLSTRKISGFLNTISSDSISLETSSVEIDRKIMFMAEPDELKTYSIQNLNKIVTVRRKLENTMKAIFFTSIAGVLVVSPLVSLENGSINWTKAKTISGICLIPAVASITISLTCWPKRHQITPNDKSKRIWKIEI